VLSVSTPSNVPVSVLQKVPEASNYRLAYSLDIPIDGSFNSDAIPYSINDIAGIGSFDRVAYYLELTNGSGTQWTYVSMDAFTTNADQIGVPASNTGATFQQQVNNMNVFSNVAGVTTGTGIATGNIEFWSSDYATGSGSGSIPGNDGTYDFNDVPYGGPGYGSMQIHNYGTGQTIFGYNRWGTGGADDLGIGNSPIGNPDWTFQVNAGSYTVRRMHILVREGNTGTLLANDTDADNDPLTVTAFDPTSTLGATVNVNANGTFTYNPTGVTALNALAAGQSVVDTFTYKASDGPSTDPATVSITVTGVNDAPTINGTPAITIAEDSAYAFTPTAADVDAGAVLTYSIVNKPTWATFSTTTGALTGTPVNANVGTTNGIVISVSDGIAPAVNLAAFNLAVTNTNDAPTITGTPATTIAEDAAYSFIPTAVDVDAGAVLTYAIVNKPTWATFSTTTGALTGTPVNANVGNTNGIVISVSDGIAPAVNLAAFNLAVTNTNDAPTITGTPATTIAEDSAYSFIPTAADVDTGAVLTYSIVNKPAWATFSTSTGALTGTPINNNVGTTTGIVISVSDGIAPAVNLAAFDLTVTNTNDAPVFNSGNLIVNGDFETGNLNGWTKLVESGSAGDVFVTNATTSPSSGATLPTSGNSFVAVTDQSGPGGYVLYQDITLVPSTPYTLSFKYFIGNRAGVFSTPNSMSKNTFPNQQVRVDVVNSTSTSFFTGAATDGVLANIVQTPVGSTVVFPNYQTSTFDLSSFAGQTVRLAFRQTDNQGTFQFGIDDVKVTSAGGAGGALVAGTEDTDYTINATDLLAGFSDVDGDTLSVTNLAATNGVLTNNNDGTYKFTPTADYNGNVVLTYNVSDGNGGIVAGTRSFNLAPVNDLPTGTVTISGTATQGQTLTAANTLADIDGLGLITYQWQADGVDIAGATTNTFVLTQAQVGKVIIAKAGYTDAQGTIESVASSATSAVVNVNDAPIGTVTISGTATEDQTLTASNNLTDIDGLGTVTYQWQADGVDIAGATANTLVLGQAQVGKVITAKASYIDLQTTAESVTSSGTTAIANVNDLPIGTVTISGTPTEDQTLTASNSLTDEDGLGTIGYQWFADGATIAGATGTTLTLDQTAVGKVITVQASYTDQQGQAESVTSTGTTAVVNLNDLPTGAVTISGTPTEDQTLTVSNTLADEDGLGTIAYQWQADGTDIAGATGATLVLDQAQVGKVITAKASYTDLQGTAESVISTGTAKVANVNDLPTGTVTISGTATQGQTLTAANTLADADGLGTIAYQWQADNVDITGATGATFVLGQAQVGKVITAKASYIDLQGTAESVTSTGTAAIVNVNDLPTGAVTITGTATEDQTLTATNNLADVDGLGPITYQWQADGVDIGGAIGATFVLTPTQIGKIITAKASYTDLQGAAESVTSAATSAVVHLNHAPIGTVTITGTATQAQTLTASNNLTDIDGLAPIAYQWQADNVDIAGATGATLILGQAQVGKTISVKASYTDLLATAESVRSATTGVVANINDLPTGTVTINGTATEDQILTAANTLADIDGLGTITYQWQADGIDIAGATGTTLVLDQAQVGKAIGVKASYIDLQGTPESLTSAATGLVGNINDAPIGTVTINGVPVFGQTLSVANDISDADGIGAITYQWQADGVDIVGAIGASFVLGQAEVGKVITAKAGYIDAQGTTESVLSSPTALITGIQTPNNLTTTAGISAQSVANWATDLTQPGYPAGLSYVVTVDRPELFAQLPTISPTGQLVYEPKPYVNVNALVNVTIQVKQADGSIDLNLTKNAVLNIKYKPEALIRNSATNEVGLLYIDQVTQLQAQRNLTQAGQNVTITPEWAISDTADFNRDGIADILLHNQSGDEVSMWMMGANGQVMATHSLQGQDGKVLKTGNLNWKVVGFADIDRDNIFDIVWHNQQSDEVAFWFMNADGINVRSYDYLRDGNGAILKTGNPLWQVKAVDDLDGDGDSDLLFQLPELNQTAIVQLNGPSLVSYAYIAAPTEAGFAIRSVGDSNGDRIADIYWQNAENTTVLIQTITAQSPSNNFTPVVSIAPLQGIADLDLNNTNDLLFRSTGLLLDLVNPAQPQLLNTPLVQAGQAFQFGDINWNIVKTDDFGEVSV
jgi:VCBS repeat-containing protein